MEQLTKIERAETYAMKKKEEMEQIRQKTKTILSVIVTFRFSSSKEQGTRMFLWSFVVRIRIATGVAVITHVNQRIWNSRLNVFSFFLRAAKSSFVAVYENSKIFPFSTFFRFILIRSVWSVASPSIRFFRWMPVRNDGWSVVFVLVDVVSSNFTARAFNFI